MDAITAKVTLMNQEFSKMSRTIDMNKPKPEEDGDDYENELGVILKQFLEKTHPSGLPRVPRVLLRGGERLYYTEDWFGPPGTGARRRQGPYVETETETETECESERDDDQVEDSEAISQPIFTQQVPLGTGRELSCEKVKLSQSVSLQETSRRPTSLRKSLSRRRWKGRF